MTVYVDLLFGLNTVINFLLLRGSAAIGGCPAGFFRLLGAAAFGGLYAVASVLPGFAFLQMGIYPWLIGGVMLILAFGFRRSTVKQGLFFFALSFAFSGAVLLLVQVAEPDCIFLGDRAYYGVTTPALLLLAGLSYGFAAVILSGWGEHTGGDIVTMELEMDGNTAVVRALRDTGNSLRDPLTGQGILVVQWQVLAQLLPQSRLTREAFADPGALVEQLNRTCSHLRFRLVPYEAVGVGRGLLPAVSCRVRQKKTLRRTLVAFTDTELSAQGRFEALTGGVMV